MAQEDLFAPVVLGERQRPVLPDQVIQAAIITQEVIRMFVVEPYAPGDQANVIGLVLRIQQNELGVPVSLDDQPDLKDVAAFYSRGCGGFWVAREADAVVGTIGLLDNGSGEATLRKMFVRHDRRGKAHSVAAQLFQVLLGHARARSVRRILLGTRPEMRAAHRFYDKHGFVRIPETDLPTSFPRMAVDSVFYRLDLGDSA